jgi:heterodisulfide reductase subunit A
VEAVGPKVAVIGGGIAGIQAALDLAEMGIGVYLIERKTFPTNDCSI